jgi:signal transduction histidine kinase/CheY-like chemotaxis protein
MSVADIIGSVSINPEANVRQLLGEKHIVVESVHLTKDAHLLPVEVNATLFTLNGRPTVQSICRDITERKKAEAERDRLLAGEREARAQAETANRIKDEFLAVLSHELRTPLNPILGWSKLLRSRKCDPTTTERALETIERNAKLQTQLIEDLLDVSRILQGKLSLNVSPVNLVSVIEAAIETVALAAQAKSIEIKTAFDPNVGQVSGDPNRLQQVVWNLLSNAVKFTPQGGQVEVQLSSSSEAILSPDLNSSPSALSTQHSALMKVSDTGIGIEPAFLPHVFDYFRQEDSTTTRRFGGLGVGLAIVRHLVELHGGRVWASSLGEGQGATFCVTLPLMNLKPESPENHLLLDDFPKLEGVRILVVDDEVDTLELLQFILKQYGAQVKAVAAGTEALEVLASWKPEILVSDIGMPNFDGYMLIQQIRSLPPEQGGAISAIALTAYAGEADTQKIINAGFQGHITKPVEVATLITAIAQLVRGER